MSNFKRQAIVSIAAIAGAQLTSLVLSPPAAESSDCLQWAAEGINHAIQRESAREPADPTDARNYWENNVWADPQPQAVATPSAITPQPLARTQAVPLSPRAVAPSTPVAISPSYSTGDPVLDAKVAAVERETDNGTYVPSNSGVNVGL